MTLSGEVDLARLVGLSAQQLDLDIQYDPRQLQQRVTLRLGEDVSAERLWALTNDLLATHGMTTVRRPGSDVYSVVTLQSAPGAAALETDPAVAARSGFGSLVVRLESQPVTKALEVIRPLLTRPGGTVTALGESGMILISDQGTRLAEIALIIDDLDAASAPLAATRYVPEGVSAQRLLKLSQELRAAGEQVAGLRLPRGQLLASPDGRALLIVASSAETNNWIAFLRSLDQAEGLERRVYPVDGFGLGEVRSLIEASLAGECPRNHLWVGGDLNATSSNSMKPLRLEITSGTFGHLTGQPAYLSLRICFLVAITILHQSHEQQATYREQRKSRCPSVTGGALDRV